MIARLRQRREVLRIQSVAEYDRTDNTKKRQIALHGHCLWGIRVKMINTRLRDNAAAASANLLCQ